MIIMKIVFEIATLPLAATTVTVSAIIAIAAIVINVRLDTTELSKVPLAIATITTLALAAIRAFACSK